MNITNCIWKKIAPCNIYLLHAHINGERILTHVLRCMLVHLCRRAQELVCWSFLSIFPRSCSICVGLVWYPVNVGTCIILSQPHPGNAVAVSFVRVDLAILSSIWLPRCAESEYTDAYKFTLNPSIHEFGQVSFAKVSVFAKLLHVDST